MAKLLIFTCLLSIVYQVQSQIMSPLGLLGRPYTESIIESPRNYIEVPIESSRNYINVPRPIDVSRNYIQPQTTIVEPPCISGNGIVPINIPGVPNMGSTTIITDCTPSVCKSLADTINLMIVSNILQSSKIGDQVAMQLAAPLLREIISNPAIVGNPNYLPNLKTPNLIAPNVIAPNFLPQSAVAPNLAGSNFYAPNPGAPRLVVPNSIPSSNSPNVAVNNNALISNLLKLLGGAL